MSVKILHFCKNFFIRDRLELSNERLSQNLENLYKKKNLQQQEFTFELQTMKLT